MGQFGIGQAVRRTEDVRFITGKGRYTDDEADPRQAYAVFLRSPHAHARIESIAIDAAKRAPGVLAVYTGADIAAAKLGTIQCVAPLKNRDGSNYFNPGRPLLAQGKVRHVGDPVALVIAESVNAAKDAAELIEVDYAPLAAVIDPAAAVAAGAPALWDEAPGNVALDWSLGDARPVEAAFAKAAKIVALDLAINRTVVAPLEPRAILAAFDPATERYTLNIGTQGAFGMRSTVAQHLGIKDAQLRVITRDVGGSFGMKTFDFPENTLLPWAAKRLGRPIKWTSERQEAFLADTQGREQKVHAELALDQDGHFLAVRAETLANMGAYLSQFSVFVATMAGFRLLTGAYRIPAAAIRVRTVFTNTVWVDAYRGAGRPECSYIIERLVDAAARDTGLGRDEIRRRNLVPPSAMPYATPLIAVYDSGDFPANLELGLKAADWAGFERRRAEARARGKLLGLGISYYMEVTAAMPQEKADIQFLPTGRVRLGVGTGPSGQGHATAFAQILADRLGIDLDRIDFVTGDTDALSQGGGTGGAKSLLLAGTAIVDGAEKIIAKGKTLAGHFLEAAEGDIEFRDGRFAIAGTDRAIDILELAAKTRAAKTLPAGLPATLDDAGLSTGNKNTFPNGTHLCEIEIDEETGAARILRYTVVDDFGVLVNPLIVEGQIHGGIAQGAGQVLLEDAHFDPASGQLLSGSFQDYAMPRADDFSGFDVTFHNVPCATNLLGIKGAGEAGTVGALGATMNAVMDALSPLGITQLDLPATPQRLWAAIQKAKAG
ncbi:MAG TPA: xanthine dehydrogenase family protein molybdopterin-binding subunit [Stellaceae bacterium]|jgi:carbon-monoxide dehydrogenase large subunit|nr:xanthine dehydrogenase family protein molybdopterin-binding subunit [Stellaceae bacterium]